MKLYIPIILGTVRSGRESEKIAQFYKSILDAREDISTEIIDIRSLDLPMNDEGTALREKNTWYRDKIVAADGIIIVTPEYNHSFPGSLKCALDVLYEEYNRKAAAICTVSNGYFGGARCAESLIHVLRKLGLYCVRTDVYNPMVEKFDPQGDTAFLQQSIEKQLTELVWLARSLKSGREAQGSDAS